MGGLPASGRGCTPHRMDDESARAAVGATCQRAWVGWMTRARGERWGPHVRGRGWGEHARGGPHVSAARGLGGGRAAGCSGCAADVSWRLVVPTCLWPD